MKMVPMLFLLTWERQVGEEVTLHESKRLDFRFTLGLLVGLGLLEALLQGSL